MTQYQPTLYDRILDWFSANRMAIAKVVVLVAVAAMMGGIVIGALIGVAA